MSLSPPVRYDSWLVSFGLHLPPSFPHSSPHFGMQVCPSAGRERRVGAVDVQQALDARVIRRVAEVRRAVGVLGHSWHAGGAVAVPARVEQSLLVAHATQVLSNARSVGAVAVLQASVAAVDLAVAVDPRRVEADDPLYTRRDAQPRERVAGVRPEPFFAVVVVPARAAGERLAGVQARVAVLAVRAVGVAEASGVDDAGVADADLATDALVRVEALDAGAVPARLAVQAARAVAVDGAAGHACSRCRTGRYSRPSRHCTHPPVAGLQIGAACWQVTLLQSTEQTWLTQVLPPAQFASTTHSKHCPCAPAAGSHFFGAGQSRSVRHPSTQVFPTQMNPPGQ